MPHIITEYTEGLSDKIADLMPELHQNLCGQPTVAMEAVKTRAIPVYSAVIGDGETQKNMIHVTLKLLPGRDDDLKKQMAQGLFDTISKYVDIKSSSISVEVTELHKESYCK